MSKKIKKASKFSAKLFGVIAFTILFVFNIQIAFGNNTNDGISIFGYKITFFNDLSAKQKVPTNGDGGGGGGGGGPQGHFANYGTRVRTVYCQRATVSDTGIVTVTFWWANVYWLVEHCDSGGNSCDVGTTRLTYQGGGC